MDSFRDNVFYLLLWRAILATLIAIVLMVTRTFALGGAFLIGAHVALLFLFGSVGSMTKAWSGCAPGAC
ncbi:MAG: hypothetical protein WBW99_08605 [Pseudolabrys sp.]